MTLMSEGEMGIVDLLMEIRDLLRTMAPSEPEPKAKAAKDG